MREQRQIVERWRRGEGSILATLIRVEGSSYRRPGARMLICQDGSYVGSISAGCLEADLLRKASWLAREGAAVERYSTLFDDAGEIPFGLGCGGVLDVLLESTETAECQALFLAMDETLKGCEHSIATWLPEDGRPLMRSVFSADGQLVFSSNGLPPELQMEAELAWSLKDNRQSPRLLMEQLVPPQRLFIFGAGDDARPLATMARLLGWTVIVADGRSHLTRKDRFPDTEIRISSSVREVLQEVNCRDAVVIMTHSFEQDGECLAALLPLQPRYLGLLGARLRSSLLLADAASAAGLSVSECCERVCAPIGLDLGGEGPEAIALAIMAEAQACCAGRKTESRRLSPDLVEQYLAENSAQTYAQARCALSLV